MNQLYIITDPNADYDTYETVIVSAGDLPSALHEAKRFLHNSPCTYKTRHIGEALDGVVGVVDKFWNAG